MDKYIINANANGRINLVGVNTENGFELIEIKDNQNATNYIKELQEINKRYGGDFFTALNNGEVKAVSRKKIERQHIETNVPGTANIRKQVLKKRIAAVAAVALIAVGATKVVANANNMSFKDAMKNIKTKALAASIFNAKKENNTEEKKESLKGKTVQELIEMLNTNEQKSAFKKIVNTQDYFNETAAPTVRQGDKQLYFTFDETASAYLYANAKSLSSDKLASVFGKSKIMLFNEETGEYETMDKDTVAAKYMNFNLNLSYYYQLGATEKSGVDQLFENENEAEFFRNFEAKILEYNKTKSPEVAAEIRAELENIFMSGQIDSQLEQYKGASSIIGTSIVPYLYLNGVIDEDMYNSLVEINESNTCDDIYNQIGKIMESLKANGQENIIERIAKLQNKKVEGLDRNVVMTEAIDNYKLSDLDDMVYTSTPGFTKNKTVTKHHRKVTTSRKAAIKAAGLEAVVKAEKEADKKAGIPQKNKEQDEYWDGFMDGYNKAYDNVMGGGSGHVSTPSGSSSYVSGFKAGVAKGIAAAKEDKSSIDKAKKDHDKQDHTKRETESETFVPENNNNNNNNQNNNDSTNNESTSSNDNTTNNNNNNDSGSTQTQEPAHQSNPEPQTKTEVISEEMVYETESAPAAQSSAPKVQSSAPKAQKVVSVESHEDIETKSISIQTQDGTEYESEANVLVRE